MASALPETVREFEMAPPLRNDLPLVVLSASSTEEAVPRAFADYVDVTGLHKAGVERQQQFAKQSARGRWEMVPDSTHLIAGSQPDVVADAVFEVIKSH
jgi:hypothetical protein